MNIHLQKLKEINPNIEITEETDHFTINKLWNDESLFFHVEKSSDLQLLENLVFPEELTAIYHNDRNILEIIFTLLPDSYTQMERKFNFLFEGIEFKTYFGEPTQNFWILAKSFRESAEIETNSDFRNLEKFRDYQRRASLPNYVQNYFQNRKPINFFIEGDFKGINFDFANLAKYINFYTNFFNRKSPPIIIHENREEGEEYEKPCLSQVRDFPEVINFTKIEPVLLDVFHVIRSQTDNPRLKFIFYFQILEYCAYYNLNDDLKKKLTGIIKRPDLINNSSEYSKLIIEEFKNHFKQNDDSVKLEKLMNDYCSWNDIKMEIEHHRDYFSKELIFDGGFSISPLIASKENLDIAPSGIMNNIRVNIEKIRNVLVHLRENRENKVILPTLKNNNKIIPYLHLIQRIAEVIAMNHD